MLTFLAGAEIDPVSLKKHWKPSLAIGAISFLLPFLGAFGLCKLVLNWHLHAAEISAVGTCPCLPPEVSPTGRQEPHGPTRFRHLLLGLLALWTGRTQP